MDTAITDPNIAKDHRLTVYMQQSLSQHASTISGVLPLSTEIKNLGKCIHLRVCCSFSLAAPSLTQLSSITFTYVTVGTSRVSLVVDAEM